MRGDSDPFGNKQCYTSLISLYIGMDRSIKELSGIQIFVAIIQCAIILRSTCICECTVPSFP